MKKVEVLSPCGSFESLRAAICAGADAVYLGAKKFSARQGAANFSDEELKEAVRECHRNGVLVYAAFNTVITDRELDEAAELLGLFCDAGVDGIIIQDFAVYEMARAMCPDMPLHASTQMSIHTPFGCKAAKRLGFSRVVAARELSLNAVKEMCDTGIDIEVFVHGALCMCVSGQCYLSAMIGGRSANRGLCAGACRLPFSALGKPDGEYALSLKDLSLCNHVGELADVGVKSLKIEGRMKRPEYVAAATNAVRSALDGEDYDESTLKAVFSRSGFTDGYLVKKLGGGMFGSRQKEDVLAAADAIPELKKIYEKPRKRFILNLEFYARTGEKMCLTASDGSFKVRVTGDEPEPAVSRGASEESVKEQISKLGGTAYEAGSVRVFIDGGLYIPLSKLNDMRRQAVAELDRLRTESLTVKKSFDRSALNLNFPMTLQLKHPRLRIRAQSVYQLSEASVYDEEIVLPLSCAKEFAEAGFDPENSVLALPRFDVDEKKTACSIEFAKTLGYERVECSNAGQIELVRSLEMTPVGGFGLNITNSLSARHFYSEGLKTLVLSPELRAVQCSSVACPGEIGAIVYGRLPVMITRNCPIAAQTGCKNCGGKLTDRTGAEFKVLCHKNDGVYELLNSRPIWMAEKLDELNLDFGDIYLTDEAPEEAAEVISSYKKGKEAGALFTRGRFYKGVD